MSLPVVLAMSIGAHFAIAAALAALPTMGRLVELGDDLLVSVDFLELPTPIHAAAALSEPPVAVLEEPRPARVPDRVVPRPAVLEPEPPAESPVAPVATAAPPSVDEVFGDPPPPMESLTAGGGGFAAAAGDPAGRPGGRAGGTPGGAVGAGALAAGPSDDEDAADRRRAREAYKRELERFLRDRMSYPRAASRERIEGRVELALRIGTDGSLLGVRVASSSGFDLLDREAVATARDAGRMPAPPEPCALRSGDELRVGLVYRLR